MASPSNDNLFLKAPKHLDSRYSKVNGPYISTTEAHNTITYKVIGLPMVIGTDISNFDLYWYKGGLNEGNIVPILGGYVPTSRQISGHPLTANISLVSGDVGLSNVPNIDATQASNLLSGTINSARFGSASIPITAINATGGGTDDFLTKGGVWKQPDAQNLYFSTRFSGAGTEGSPITISAIVTKFNSYTTTERDALSSLVDGDTIYNKTVKALQTWDATTSAWV